MRTLIRSIVIWGVVGLCTLLFFPVVGLCWLLLSPFDPARRATGWLSLWWAQLLLRTNPLWEIEVTGTERLSGREAYLFTPNHQSFGDIMVVSFLGVPHRFIAKRSLFFFPVLGWSMWMAEHIPVLRGNRESGRQALAKAERLLRRGASVVIFPEGTRSRDGRVGPFRDGAFALALRAGVPVVPVAITGSRNALPKGTWLFTQRTRCTLTVFEPIPTAGLTEADVPALRTRVREIIASRVDAVQGGDAEAQEPRAGVADGGAGGSGAQAGAGIANAIPVKDEHRDPR